MKYAPWCVACALFFSSAAFSIETILSDPKETSFTDFLIKQALKLTDKTPPPPSSLAPKELVIDLHNPKFKNGILYTNEGGVIQNEDIRIQARSMQYITRREGNGLAVHKIEAEGDLMLQFKGKVYVGDELEFDFQTKTGVMYNGKTYASPFYIGGDRLLLKKDGDYIVENAYLTTCENKDSTWDIHAAKVDILKENMLKAKQVRFRFLRFPSFWLPSFKLNLKKFSPSILRYKLTWDKGAGPRATVRLQVYSWKNFALFLRGEYRLRKGFGGAIETEYFPEHGRTTFVTQNYLASDVIPTNIEKKRRYRVRGEYNTSSKSGETCASLTWDKFSDVLMPGDFRSDDFELNAAKKTQLYIRHHEKDLIATLYARARANPFETIKQELPTIFGSMRPLALANTGIVVENWVKASYLDFDYSDRLTAKLPDFHSGRLETRHEAYRPFHLGHFLLNPYVGVVGIYYTNSPLNRPMGFGLIKFGFLSKFELHRLFSHYKHVIQPYLGFDGYSRPTSDVDKHYIFSIQDGYNEQNLIKIGVKNLLFSRMHPRVLPSFYTDLYANAFFNEHTIPRFIPKFYLTFGWNLPSLAITSTNGWNVWHHRLDFANLRTEWTINQDAAMTFELRYRSKFDWRKADHENFFVDVTRHEDELLASPLSDQRITILSRFFFRINPFWTAHIESHHGFMRKGQPPYTEFKIDLFTWIATHWKLRLSYLHTQRDDRVSAGFELVKK